MEIFQKNFKKKKIEKILSSNISIKKCSKYKYNCQAEK